MKKSFEERYILGKKLGQGSYGTVYVVFDREEKKHLACKFLRGTAKESEKRAFVMEAKLLSQLKHPSIPKFYDFGTTRGGIYYLAMEYIEGKTLEEKMQESDFTLNDAISIFCRLCNTMQYIHSIGLVHNDIKPKNIIVTEEKHVVILDWGSAKPINKKAIKSRARLKKSIKGTPLYTAPELILQFYPSPASDQYALGVILYELLSGDYPFYETDINSLFFRVCCENPRLPRREERKYDVSDEVFEVALRLLAKKPEDRFENCIQVNMALHQAFTKQLRERQNAMYPPAPSHDSQQKWFVSPATSQYFHPQQHQYLA